MMTAVSRSRFMERSRWFIEDHPLVSLMFLLLCLLTSLVIYSATVPVRVDPAEAARQQAESDRQSAAEMAKMKADIDIAGLKVWLRDPQSAQFSAVRHFVKDGKEVTCGLVNSRNGFGGMSGPDPFAVVDFQVNISSMARSAAKVVDTYC